MSQSRHATRFGQHASPDAFHCIIINLSSLSVDNISMSRSRLMMVQKLGENKQDAVSGNLRCWGRRRMRFTGEGFWQVLKRVTVTQHIARAERLQKGVSGDDYAHLAVVAFTSCTDVRCHLISPKTFS